MKLTKLGLGLMAMGLVAVGCGSDDNTCGDAACPDSAVGGLDGGVDAAPLGSITSGKYKALSANLGEDGCMINAMDLVTKNADPTYWLPVEVTGGIMTVGNKKGDGVTDLPSLGTGPYGGATFTLKRMNHVKVGMGSPCEYDADVTSTITNDAIDSFGIGVVEKQTNRVMCTVPAGVGASCASTYSFRMQKAGPL
jgi:hypothetical protein